MTSVTQREPTPVRWWVVGRWSFWCLCVAAWTVALLTLFPVALSRQLPEGLRFPTAKVAHVSAYTFLTVLTVWLPVRGRARWLCVAFLSLHSFVTEYLQTFVGRGGELRDVGWDHLGIVLGLAIGWRRWRGRAERGVLPDQ